jgi:hypothetical protein
MRVHIYLVLLMPILLAGCGHTSTTNIGLLSFGDLNGKLIPATGTAPILEGEDCGGVGGVYYLSNAVRDALKGTEYDTLVDVEVTNDTGYWVWSNCVSVKGQAHNSRSLVHHGGSK